MPSFGRPLLVPLLVPLFCLALLARGASATPPADGERAAKIRLLLEELRKPAGTAPARERLAPPEDAGGDLSLPDDRVTVRRKAAPGSPAGPVKAAGRAEPATGAPSAAKNVKPSPPPSAKIPAPEAKEEEEEDPLSPLPSGAFTPDRDGRVEFDRARIGRDLMNTAARYRIGPGDLIELNVFDGPEFSKDYTVSPDGAIMLPICGRFEVAGLTAEEASADARRLLKAILVDPKVVVSVKSFQNNYVLAIGRFVTPGRYDFKGIPTLLELFSLAKGVESIAARSGQTVGVTTSGRYGKCMIFRGKDQIIEVDLDRLINDGMLDLNLPLQSGDVVNVPVAGSMRYYVLGQVVNPGMFPYEKGNTVLHALTAAGSSRDKADLKRVRILRAEGDRRRVIPCDVSEILRGKRARDLELLPDDIVYVPVKGVEKFLYTTGWINSALQTIMIGDSFARTIENWD